MIRLPQYGIGADPENLYNRHDDLQNQNSRPEREAITVSFAPRHYVGKLRMSDYDVHFPLSIPTDGKDTEP